MTGLVKPKRPYAASTSPEPGTFHFGVSVQGWSDATSDWVV